MLLVAVFVGDDALERGAFDFKVGVADFLKGAVLLALLTAYLFGGFDFLTVPHGLDALGADFCRHFRAVAFGYSADLLPDQAPARTEVDEETQIRRTVEYLVQLVHIDARPLLGVIPLVF